MIYAVIDTNVFVAALLTKHRDAATAKVVEAMVAGRITAVKSPEIMAEYRDVLTGGILVFPKEALSAFSTLWRRKVLILRHNTQMKISQTSQTACFLKSHLQVNR